MDRNLREFDLKCHLKEKCKYRRCVEFMLENNKYFICYKLQVVL